MSDAEISLIVMLGLQAGAIIAMKLYEWVTYD